MKARDATVRRRSMWRFGVPVVCAAAGLLLGATHGVSGGDEIRRSDAPRLVDLVRETQRSVDRLTAERDALAPQIENHHGGSPPRPRRWPRSPAVPTLAPEAALTPLRGPGLVVTLNDAQRDAQGGSRATPRPTTSSCTSRTSPRCSTHCGVPAPKASRCRTSA